MSLAVKAENISKRYVIKHKGHVSNPTMRDFIYDKAKSLFTKKEKNLANSTEEFWALKGVDFEIYKGDKIGIIGKNGAGKSTLLKILSRITEPTTGKISTKGRVASLLEVGTGFHPELTGRENIFLNGAILGMRKEEIKIKFDEIVDFSGVEKFLDTPVKRYSSGMYVRLAFAVAAHLETEILIVDEVLAVGDAEFQKKCLGKMEDVSKRSGRTILFVSHNIAALSNLCNKAMVLKNGKVDFPLDEVSKAVHHYLANTAQQFKINLDERKDRSGEGKIRLSNLEITGADGHIIHSAISGQKIKFKIYYKCINNPHPRNISVGITIYRSDGFLVTVLNNEIAMAAFDNVSQSGYFSCELAKLPLTAGNYIVHLIVRQDTIIQDWIQDVAAFTVEDGDFYGTGKNIPTTHKCVLFEQVWSEGSSS